MSRAERVQMDLAGRFWTRLHEMIEDIEDYDYTVTERNYEYVSVTDDMDDCAEYILYLGHANSTMWIDKVVEA